MFRIYVWWFMLVVTLSYIQARRGPHHPRGQEACDRIHHHYQPEKTNEEESEEKKCSMDNLHHEHKDGMVIPDTELEKMTPDELEFYYFDLHDLDRDHKLDGLEMIKLSLHRSGKEDANLTAEEMEALIAHVDQTLLDEDLDADGFISFLEHRAGHNPTLYNQKIPETELQI